MTISLRPYQTEAVALLRSEIAKKGEMAARMPIGMGRSIVLIEALRDAGRVGYLSMRRETHQQMAQMCAHMGVKPFPLVHVGHDLSQFDVILACESMHGRAIDHPCVVRESSVAPEPSIHIARFDGEQVTSQSWSPPPKSADAVAPSWLDLVGAYVRANHNLIHAVTGNKGVEQAEQAERDALQALRTAYAMVIPE